MLTLYTRHIQSLMPIPLKIEINGDALVRYRKGAIVLPTRRVHEFSRAGEVVG